MPGRNFLIALILGDAACAGATTGARQSPCTLTATDSAYLAGGPVFREYAVDQRAHLRNPQVRPDFQPPQLPTGGSACYSAQIELVVDTAGMPEAGTAHVLTTNNPPFADAVLFTVPRWRYDPARKGGVAVRQIVRERRVVAVQVVAVPAGAVPSSPGRRPRC